MKKLTQQQELFVAEYMKDLDGTKAAKRAGYKPKNAGQMAYELLRKPHIKAACAKFKIDTLATAQIDAAWLLKRLATEASADIEDIYDWDGTLLPISEWPKIWRQGLVTEVDMEKGKIKVSDRLKRLELIGKHVGIQAFSEQTAVRHTIDDVSDDELLARLTELRKSK